MVGRVLIVGGGVAGLSAALALRRSRAEVDVVELDPRWAVDDIGLIVHANFIRALAALCITPDALSLGFSSDGVSFQDFAGNPLSPMPDAQLEVRPYPPNVGVSRTALHKLLASSVLAAGANVRLGVTFSRIVQCDSRVAVTLTDGSVGHYDLVIGADGVHSSVRSAVFGTHLNPQFTGQYRWRYNVRAPSECLKSLVRVKQDGTRYGYLPITARTGSMMLLDNEPLGFDCHPLRLPEMFRSRLADCTGQLAELREQIVDPDKVLHRPVEVLFMASRWYKGRVLLIGDACHAMSAHMAQGAVQAVEDGVVLGELAAREMEVPQLLEAFMERRYARCKLIAETTLLVEKSDQHALTVPHVAQATKRMLEVAASPI